MSNGIRLVRLTAGALAGLTVSCIGLSDLPGTSHCYLHCWEYEFTVPDVDEDGYMDDQCTNHWTGVAMQVPVPAGGSLVARACLHLQAEHDGVKAILAARSNGTLGSVSEVDRASWKILAAQLQEDAYAQCLNHVSGSPGYQDIDPNLGGSQACIPTSAELLCSYQVEDPLADSLSLESSALDVVPTYAGVEWGLAYEAPCSYVPEATDTDAVAPDMQGTSGADQGVDSSEGAGAERSLEEVAQALSCSAGRCYLNIDLRAAVAGSFSTFYAEGVELALVNAATPCSGRGLRLSGLDAGEESRALADKIGVRNGDLLVRVEGVAPIDAVSLEQIVNDLQDTLDPIDFSVKRVVSSRCLTFDYVVNFVQ